ncbi:TVP38/TMEM64 family protein [Robertmurraya massiliosenegalensis]|uniref:TVP38/TMEM64 family protein n=1 Tax=Robertmurraya massiliosenegalensis TaxID=1287657 RepID=UPI0002F0737D|nr:VTT domain-containing protein [Robertmurraya massiliosenegalensis]
MLELFPENPLIASLISILLNIAVAIAGIFPSTFITIGTISILGFNLGVIILILGEAAGAIISFTLYRRGLHKLSSYSKFSKIDNKFLRKLKDSDGVQPFLLVILLRILPFIPSGIVTLVAAFSKIGTFPFIIASTFGKIPAIITEAYSVTYFLNLGRELQILIVLVVLFAFLIYLILKPSFNK